MFEELQGGCAAGAGRVRGRVTEDEVRENKDHALVSVPLAPCSAFPGLDHGCNTSAIMF